MRRSTSDNPPDVTLPITPMLDMTFQLLFFFITSFNPADQEGQIEMALPSENIVANKENKPDPKADVDKNPLEFPTDLTVKVRTQLDGVNDGDISALSILNTGGKEEQIDGGLKGLRKYLEKRQADIQGESKGNIKVQGDSKLKVSKLMEVMDQCRLAGFKNVSMVPPEDFGR
jgi:biopolymer transport protein ExbD